MKALVAVKRVVDFNVKVRVKADGSNVDTDNVKMSMNPFDEIAVEEAVRLKEAGKLSEVIVLSIGVKKCEEILRIGLAMGADRAIHVETDKEIETLAVAKIIQKIVEKENPDLIFLGKQAIDNEANQVGQMLAALINAPQGTFVSKIELSGGEVEITREIDGGLEMLVLKLPAVITTDLRLNEPRYIKLPNIMQAKKKSLDKVCLEELGVDIEPRIEILAYIEPKPRTGGVKVQSVQELVDKLKNEAKVI
ncbi:MAG: EtfB protein [Neisseriaceae bacterium]|nr:MAG: EtfB protein [Neisseriaceae bacterium]